MRLALLFAVALAAIIVLSAEPAAKLRRHVAREPKVAVEPETGATRATQPEQTAVATAIYSARRELGRALAYTNPARKRAGLRGVETLVADLRREYNDPDSVVELLAVQSRVYAAIGDFAAVEKVVREMHATWKQHHSPDGFRDWLKDQIDPLRRIGSLDLTIVHLSEAVAADPNARTAPEWALQIGDVLTQRFHPNGPYDRAIREYERVAERYRASNPDIADDARLRQAKLLWRNNQPEEAERLFAELVNSANSLVSETAEHYELFVTSPPERPKGDLSNTDNSVKKEVTP